MESANKHASNDKTSPTSTTSSGPPCTTQSDNQHPESISPEPTCSPIINTTDSHLVENPEAPEAGSYYPRKTKSFGNARAEIEPQRATRETPDVPDTRDPQGKTTQRFETVCTLDHASKAHEMHRSSIPRGSGGKSNSLPAASAGSVRKLNATVEDETEGEMNDTPRLSLGNSATPPGSPRPHPAAEDIIMHTGDIAENPSLVTDSPLPLAGPPSSSRSESLVPGANNEEEQGSDEKKWVLWIPPLRNVQRENQAQSDTGTSSAPRPASNPTLTSSSSGSGSGSGSGRSTRDRGTNTEKDVAVAERTCRTRSGHLVTERVAQFAKLAKGDRVDPDEPDDAGVGGKISRGSSGGADAGRASERVSVAGAERCKGKGKDKEQGGLLDGSIFGTDLTTSTTAATISAEIAREGRENSQRNGKGKGMAGASVGRGGGSMPGPSASRSDQYPPAQRQLPRENKFGPGTSIFTPTLPTAQLHGRREARPGADRFGPREPGSQQSGPSQMPQPQIQSRNYYRSPQLHDHWNVGYQYPHSPPGRAPQSVNAMDPLRETSMNADNPQLPLVAPKQRDRPKKRQRAASGDGNGDLHHDANEGEEEAGLETAINIDAKFWERDRLYLLPRRPSARSSLDSAEDESENGTTIRPDPSTPRPSSNYSHRARLHPRAPTSRSEYHHPISPFIPSYCIPPPYAPPPPPPPSHFPAPHPRTQHPPRFPPHPPHRQVQSNHQATPRLGHLEQSLQSLHNLIDGEFYGLAPRVHYLEQSLLASRRAQAVLASQPVRVAGFRQDLWERTGDELGPLGDGPDGVNDMAETTRALRRAVHSWRWATRRSAGMDGRSGGVNPAAERMPGAWRDSQGSAEGRTVGRREDGPVEMDGGGDSDEIDQDPAGGGKRDDEDEKERRLESRVYVLERRLLRMEERIEFVEEGMSSWWADLGLLMVVFGFVLWLLSFPVVESFGKL
ncbi:hypothetical protein MKZ38_010726 [Zalerion maritima]|uniref:Uncharacterized protein n=1 Tax=Zalerion maritima TaxID=339359 RepID=A0AAD5RFU2_9PEZI|nr:hypothetical protein MKZ38_010726 [Zalerion maritima]